MLLPTDPLLAVTNLSEGHASYSPCSQGDGLERQDSFPIFVGNCTTSITLQTSFTISSVALSYSGMILVLSISSHLWWSAEMPPETVSSVPP